MGWTGLAEPINFQLFPVILALRSNVDISFHQEGSEPIKQKS